MPIIRSCDFPERERVNFRMPRSNVGPPGDRPPFDLAIVNGLSSAPRVHARYSASTYAER